MSIHPKQISMWNEKGGTMSELKSCGICYTKHWVTFNQFGNASGNCPVCRSPYIWHKVMPKKEEPKNKRKISREAMQNFLREQVYPKKTGYKK